MNAISSLPNLKNFVVYGSGQGWGWTKQGFDYIEKIKSLETLILVNTKITDQSIIEPERFTVFACVDFIS